MEEKLQNQLQRPQDMPWQSQQETAVGSTLGRPRQDGGRTFWKAEPRGQLADVTHSDIPEEEEHAEAEI